MVKSKRKKKQRIEDFPKSKVKLGKTKPQSDSFTNTSFKSKSIVIRTQSISIDKSKCLTNYRNLTYKELSSQLRHHNLNIRKDAIVGIKDYFQRYPHTVAISIGSFIQDSSKLIADEDSSVRKALRSLYGDLISQLEERQIHPYLNLLLTHVCSAITHINEKIRCDAFVILNLLLDNHPNLMRKFTSKIIQCFIGFLLSDPKFSSKSSNPFTSSVTTKSWLKNTKDSYFESLKKFLQIAIQTRQDHIKFPFLKHLLSASSQSSSLKHSTTFSIENLPKLHPFLNDYTLLDNAPGVFDHLSLFSTDSLPSHEKLDDSLFKLYSCIHPFLLATWLETAPNVFSAGVDRQDDQLSLLKMILEVTSLFSIISESCSQSKWILSKEFSQFLKHVFVYFPFGQNSLVSYSPSTKRILFEFNLHLCYLIVRLLEESIATESSFLTKEAHLWLEKAVNYTTNQYKNGSDSPYFSSVSSLQLSLSKSSLIINCKK